MRVRIHRSISACRKRRLKGRSTHFQVLANRNNPAFHTKSMRLTCGRSLRYVGSPCWLEELSKVVGRKSRQKHPPQKTENQGGKREKMEPPKKYHRKRPDALLTRPSEGKSVADVLEGIIQKAKPEKGTVRPQDNPCRKFSFSADPEFILGLTTNATVRVLETKSKLELRYIDELTTDKDLRIEGRFSWIEDGNLYPGCQRCSTTSSQETHQDWVSQMSRTQKVHGLQRIAAADPIGPVSARSAVVRTTMPVLCSEASLKGEQVRHISSPKLRSQKK
ncbi:hypothetical protein J6590_063157 [Homalodisca vitripennis]|nr:hypothetical protein J6590_063157 [Homalodisca vitripennis]